MRSSIALVMIARDESRCIERALRSAARWVDAMWVLDTGSSDDTREIARGCGARVPCLPWRDDFAAARNAALGFTDCDWRLVLDADEWIESGGEALAALRGEPPAHLGLLRIDSAATGDTLASSWLPRLLPRGVAYAGRIHEQPACTLPRRRHPIVVGHDGYAPAVIAAKAGRNRRLLQLALAEAPGDAYLHYQLGKDLEVHGDVAAALPCYERAAAGAAPQAAWQHDLLLRRMRTLQTLQRHEDAFALAQQQMPRWLHSPDFFFALGGLMLDWAAAQPPLAAELLPIAEQAWTEALRIGENPALADSVRGRGSYLAAHNLAVLCDGTGRAESARAWSERSRSLREALC